MDLGIIKIKLFNAFLYLSDRRWAAFTVGIVAFMLSSNVRPLSTWGMIVSSALLLILCMPVSLYLWRSSNDRVMRTLFAGMSAGLS